MCVCVARVMRRARLLPHVKHTLEHTLLAFYSTVARVMRRARLLPHVKHTLLAFYSTQSILYLRFAPVPVLSPAAAYQCQFKDLAIHALKRSTRVAPAGGFGR